MEFREETITPEIAEKYLKKCIVNRKKRPASIRTWAGQMERGEWDLTHQGIAFNREGKLIDGQNRLQSIIKANVPVKMIVARGLEHKNYRELMVDVGNKRSFADISGNKRKPSQIVSFITKFAEPGRNPAYDQIFKYYEKFGLYAELLHDNCRSSYRLFASSPICSGAVIRMAENFGNADYIINQYRAMVLQHYDLMSPIMKAFVRYYNIEMRRGETPNEKLVRSYLVFNYDYADKSSLIVSKKTYESKIEAIRESIKNLMQD